ncbi:hypothetical protein B7463_g11914, partial [Scytalidium lignicola]
MIASSMGRQALLTLAMFTCSFRTASAETSLLPGFISPLVKYRPKFRYWLPDASVSPDSVANDVHSLKSAGAGGIEFLPFYAYGLGDPNHLPTNWSTYGFGTPAFKKVFTAALRATKEAGLHLDFALGVSQGQGVPSDPGTQGLAMELVYGYVEIGKGQTYYGSVPKPNIDWNFPPFLVQFENIDELWGPNKLVGVVGAGVKSTLQNQSVVLLDESTLVDLTDSVRNGIIHWTASHKRDNSILFAFYERYTNQRSSVSAANAETVIGNGSWVVDHFSASGVQKMTRFWEENVLNHEIRDLISKVVEHSWEDSMEMQASLLWSSNFLTKFKKNRGYSAVPYLPLFFHRSNQYDGLLPPYNSTFLLSEADAANGGKHVQDYRLTLNEGYQDFLKIYQSWAAGLGIKHSCQPAYGQPLDMVRPPPRRKMQFQCSQPSKAADVPFIPTPELESLGFNNNIDMYRQFTGAAHISGRNVISTEIGAVLTGAYTQTVPSLLNIFRGSWAAGVNRMVIHGFSYNGAYPGTTWPGYTAWWYLYGEQWNERQPAWRHLNDTFMYIARNNLVLQTGVPQLDLAFYYYQDPWNSAEIYPGEDLMHQGYTHEYIGPQNLQSSQASVHRGILAPGGPAYRALVLYNQTQISPAASQKLVEFATAGLPILIVGLVPNITIGTTGQDTVSANINRLVSRFRNVKILEPGQSLTAGLQTLRVKPRVGIQGGGNAEKFYTFWRSDAAAGVNMDSYPYILDAWTGNQSPVTYYKRTRTGLVIPVSLNANQTVILAFTSRKWKDGVYVVSHSQNIEKIYVNDDSHIEAWIGDGSESTISLSNGKTITSQQLNSCSQTLPTFDVGPWDLTMEIYGPSSNLTVLSSITTANIGRLPSLLPWTKITSLKEVSGIGIYVASFQWSEDNLVAIINFGFVANTMRAWVNGILMPPIDPANPELEISGWLVKGENQIKEEVSSTLFNTVKAQAGNIMIAGEGPRNPTYYTIPSYQDFGLLRPVTIKTLRRIIISI